MSGADEATRALSRRVLEAVRRERLWAPGDVVTVAVSGGLDSVVLLDVLASTAAAHGARLRVVSIDHGLRPEAPDEVRRVGALAAARDLPFRGVRLDVPRGADLAARLRRARRAALLADGADRIATAHHRDDQAETVLHHLLRGGGLDGLRGMRWRDGAWVRPLLGEPRDALRAYAEAGALTWTEDPSNPGSLRGRMRAVMPALDALHGGAAGALARSARLLARDAALIDHLADEAWRRCAVAGGLDAAGVRREPPALQARLLRRLLADGPGVLRADHIEAALRWLPRPQGRLGLPAGRGLVVRDGLLRVEGP